MARRLCLICSSDFYAKPRDIARGYAKFCSKQCYDKWQKDSGYHRGKNSPRWNSLERSCKVCDKKFFESPSRVADGRGVYCSKECYAKGLSSIVTGRKHSEETRLKIREVRLGERNPAYIDGRSFKKRLYIEYGDEWTRLLRDKVFAKYGEKCNNCGETNQIIHIHHLDGEKRNNKLYNLIPLCITCHMRLHKGKYKIL